MESQLRVTVQWLAVSIVEKVSEYDHEIPQPHTVDQVCTKVDNKFNED